jgi:hypothetical protein
MVQNAAIPRNDHEGTISCRLFFLLARSSPAGVIFRRGPSKWVQLIKWDTKQDVFEAGQWFHGRIYERRCDLNPDGSLLVYFAQKITPRSLKDRDYTYAWTAVSKPPYLTALGFWPKGDCWHGGGLFAKRNVLHLNHAPGVAIPHKKHTPPKKFHVIANPHARGEDDPIYSSRLERDGWVLKQHWEADRSRWTTTVPQILEKKSPVGDFSIRLKRSFANLKYSEVFSVCRRKGAIEIPLENARWADWDHAGRLVFARDGKILSGCFDPGSELKEQELADFNHAKPKNVTTPNWALRW